MTTERDEAAEAANELAEAKQTKAKVKAKPSPSPKPKAPPSFLYDKDKQDYDWGAMDEKTLRAAYPLIRAACPVKTEDLPEKVTLDELRSICKNTHNFITLRSLTGTAPTKKSSTSKETTMTKKQKTSKPVVKAEPKAEKWAGYPLAARVQVLDKTNPAREGSAKWKRWDLVLTKGHKTIGELKKAKANPATVRNAVKAKSIKVA